MDLKIRTWQRAQEDHWIPLSDLMSGLMMIFMLVATFSSHRYWEFSDLAQRRIQDSSFWKNIAMLGGFAFLFASGPGRFSLDSWLRKRG